MKTDYSDTHDCIYPPLPDGVKVGEYCFEFDLIDQVDRDFYEITVTPFHGWQAYKKLAIEILRKNSTPLGYAVARTFMGRFSREQYLSDLKLFKDQESFLEPSQPEQFESFEDLQKAIENFELNFEPERRQKPTCKVSEGLVFEQVKNVKNLSQSMIAMKKLRELEHSKDPLKTFQDNLKILINNGSLNRLGIIKMIIERGKNVDSQWFEVASYEEIPEFREGLKVIRGTGDTDGKLYFKVVSEDVKIDCLA